MWDYSYIDYAVIKGRIHKHLQIEYLVSSLMFQETKNAQVQGVNNIKYTKNTKKVHCAKQSAVNMQ